MVKKGEAKPPPRSNAYVYRVLNTTFDYGLRMRI